MLLCLNPVTVKNEKGQSKQVGCGKCLECLRKRKNDWAQRLLAEFRYSKCTKFVTLTYDDAHIPIESVGEDRYRFTFNKKDVQKFFKRFRKLHKVRYWLVSEFGDQTQRPHYHALFFLDEYLTNPEVEYMIQMTWDAGWIIDVSDLRGPGGIYYLTNYLYKQQDDQKTFMLSSKNPAIGMRYVDNWKDRHLNYLSQDKENFDAFGLQGMVSPKFKNQLPLCRYLRDKIFKKNTEIGDFAHSLIEQRGIHFRQEEINNYINSHNCSIQDFFDKEESLRKIQNINLKNKLK